MWLNILIDESFTASKVIKSAQEPIKGADESAVNPTGITKTPTSVSIRKTHPKLSSLTSTEAMEHIASYHSAMPRAMDVFP